jgi:hypothetical protein
VSAILLCLMFVGIVRDWRQPTSKDLQFKECAKRFEAVPARTTLTIPENREGWTAQLVKDAPGQ